MKYWNKTQNTLMLFAATALLFACSQEIEAPQAPEISTLTVLTANTGSDTKISFDDQGATGVKLAWEAGDAFTVYDNTGAQVGTFTLNTGEEGASTGAFSGSVALIDGTQYTAVFPAAATTTETLSQYVHNMNAATQNGNSSTSHLSDLCYMQGSFTYAATGANLISFGHNYVLMTVKMAMPDGYTAAAKGTPNKLTFKNDAESYTLALGNNDWTGGNIVAYFMVKPAAATSRTLTVQVATTNNSTYKGTKTSSKEWVAGKRYTVDFTTTKLTDMTWEVLGGLRANCATQPGYALSNLIDGSTTTEWIASWNGSPAYGGYPRIITIDMKESKAPKSISITRRSTLPDWGFDWADNASLETVGFGWILTDVVPFESFGATGAAVLADVAQGATAENVWTNTTTHPNRSTGSYTTDLGTGEEWMQETYNGFLWLNTDDLYNKWNEYPITSGHTGRYLSIIIKNAGRFSEASTGWNGPQQSRLAEIKINIDE